MAHMVVIDDQEAMRSVLQQTLHAEGHRVSLAPDGQTGLQLLHAPQPEVLLTDLYMPQMDGIEILHTVRLQFPVLKIIAMSGGGRWNLAKAVFGDARALGAHSTLATPFTLQALCAALQAVLTEEPQS